jgi:hypothetical protein
MSLSRTQRLRRVGIVCCHMLRNLAYYRVWFEMGKPGEKQQFWVSANSNFADITVLEWCKVFADANGKHYWKKVVSNENGFVNGLLGTLNVNEPTWGDYIREMRLLRDKFIAHLDDELTMTLPLLDIAKASTIYLYTYLLANEDEGGTFSNAPQSAEQWFTKFENEAKTIYAAIANSKP